MTTDQRIRRSLLPAATALVVVLSVQVLVRAACPGEGGLEGDWEIRSSDRGARRLSILSFSSDTAGDLAGWWITDSDRSELEDISGEDGSLSFTWNDHSDQSMTWKFSGMIEEDTLRGTVSNDRQEYEVSGRPIPRMPELVGNWSFSYTTDRVTLALAVRVADEGNLSLSWQTTDGDVPITDFAYERGQLTLKSEIGNYEGSLTGPDSLNGALMVDQREYSVLASRMGTPVIGTWDLEITSDRGNGRQRLKVNPDMSGWYGTIPIERVRLEHDVPIDRDRSSRAVTFNAVNGSDERGVEMSFVGEVAGVTLRGEITTSDGTSTVVGSKVLSRIRNDEEP